MEPNDLKSIIESILFVSSEPLTVKQLAKILEQQEFAVQAALDQLATDRKESGVVVLDNNGQYQLATNARNSTQVKNFLNAELREKLTDATVEVLAIIAYRQPISKAEIEAIRGVNSQYSIRHLLMRGLVEKIPNPADARSFLYQTTTEFLQHLGLASTKNLPEFEKLVEHIKLPETPVIRQELSESESSDQPTVNAAKPKEFDDPVMHNAFVNAPAESQTTGPEPVVEESQATKVVVQEDSPLTLAPDPQPNPEEDFDSNDEEDEDEDDNDDEE